VTAAWYRDHRDLIDNTVSLVGSAAVTSGLGFAFWWVAARLFDADAVGLASAAVSAMLLLSTLGVFGLDALMLSEIPRARATAGRLTSTAVIAAFVSSALLGLAFAAAAPTFSENLRAHFALAGATAVFALGVGLTGATFVFDRASVAFLRGGIQFRRNVWFSVLKLALLPALWLVPTLSPRSDGAMVAVWTATTLISLALVLPGAWRALGAPDLRPEWPWLARLRGDALRHHMLNVAQHGPGLALPVLVVSLFPAATSAAFYVTWMLVTFAHVVPIHLTTVLHTVGAGDPARLAEKLRTTLKLSAVAAVVIVAALAVLAGPALRLFGPEYAAVAADALRVLGVTVVPVAVKVHYFALARIHGFTARAAWVGGLGGVAGLVAAGVGARYGTLEAMGAFLLGAMLVEAALLAPVVARAARAAPSAPGPDQRPNTAS
jgi:O-antigen/teichoic acid export membrane protein